MMKQIKTKKQMQGVYIILELSLLLCVTLLVYDTIFWKDIGLDFNTLIEKFDCNCGFDMCTIFSPLPVPVGEPVGDGS